MILPFNSLPFLTIKDNKLGLVLYKDSNKIGRVLRDSLLSQYKTLVCQSVVDYPELANRFENVNELLSYKKNHRFRLKEGGNEKTWLFSFVNLYPSANWSERENWDLFGVFLDGHPDLRRLISDYGFQGHPLRKDFPLSGYFDLRYDENAKTVVQENLDISQTFRTY